MLVIKIYEFRKNERWFGSDFQIGNGPVYRSSGQTREADVTRRNQMITKYAEGKPYSVDFVRIPIDGSAD